MRPVNILLLVLAGAIGGALVMRVVQRPHPVQEAAAPEVLAPPSLPSSTPPESVALSAPVAQPAAQPAAEPAETERSLSSVTHQSSGTPRSAETVITSTPPPRPIPSRPLPVRRPAIVPARRVEFQHTAARHNPGVPANVGASAPLIVAQVQTPPPAAAPPRSLTPEQPKETPPGNMEPEEVTPLPAPIPAPPEPHTVTLNAGTLIPVRLLDGLSLERNQAGDRFAATLDNELDADGFVLAERGARVEGRVVVADRSAKTLSLELTSVATSDRQEVSIQTERFEKHNDADRAQDATKVGAGAVIGAVIGGMAAGGKGAAIGAGAGAGAGAGGVMLTRKPVTLPSETRLTFRLRAPVTITERRN